MKIYLIRHGKTQWNLEGRFQGASGDSPLLPEAKKSVKKLGQTLADIPFDAIYSSDLHRAITTAEIISQEHHPPLLVQKEASLREWDLGTLEGQKISIMEAIYPKQMEAFSHNLARFDHNAFDAESVYHTTQRIGHFIKSLYGKKDSILIVGHGASLTAAIRSLLGYEYAKLRQNGGLDNASITILETNDGQDFKLITWNDTSYDK